MPSAYHSLIHFFHAESWSLGELMLQWMRWCREYFQLVEVKGRLVCVGDGIKVSKESQQQPGLKWLYNSSQNQNKPKHIRGHHFGCIAFIATRRKTYRAILQAAQLHEGVEALRKMEAVENEAIYSKESIVVRMLSLLVIVAIRQGKPLYGCLDAYFSTTPAFLYAASFLMDDGQPWVQLITRAKKSYVAYPLIPKGKKKPVTFKLFSLFQHKNWFESAPHPLHPERNVSFYYEDLYWGKQALLIRFVWVVDEGRRFILMSSDCHLDPLEILKIYGLRTQIEVAFRVLKHIIGGFCYRFWTKSYSPTKEKELSPEWTKDNPVAQNALKTLRAIERFVNLGIVAQGILSYFALIKTEVIWKLHYSSSWLRSYSSSIPSEEVVQRIFQMNFSRRIVTTSLSLWLKIYQIRPSKKIKDKKVLKITTLPHFLSG